MIRPAKILVVPNLPNQVPLGGGHRVNVPCSPVASFYPIQENKREQGPQPGAGAGDTHIFQRGDL